MSRTNGAISWTVHNLFRIKGIYRDEVVSDYHIKPFCKYYNVRYRIKKGKKNTIGFRFQQQNRDKYSPIIINIFIFFHESKVNIGEGIVKVYKHRNRRVFFYVFSSFIF